MKIITSTIIALTFLLTSCTENSRAKSWGGTGRVELPKGQKLVGVTWKENELWYLTRPMRDTDIPEFSTFQEESSFGLMEGKVIFQEKR